MTEPHSSNLRRFKRVAKAILPPVILSAYRRVQAGFRDAEPAESEYLPGGWPEKSPSIRGWDYQSVVDAHLAPWPDFRAGAQSTAPFALSREPGGANEVNCGLHNAIMSFGYVLARATERRTRLSMLDWEGGVGDHYVYARALLPDLDPDYHCRELPLLAKGGRLVLPEATFHTDDETAFARHYDFVMASSSIQHVRDWRATLKRLATVTDGYMYLTRVPVVEHAPSYVVLQRPDTRGYETEYPGWFLNRDEFLSATAGLGLTLLREFLIWERPVVPNAPEAADLRGFLFSATGRRATSPAGGS